MKIGITGHSKGIGKSLLEKFENNGHTVKGFSRSNGYDITDSSIQDSIISEIIDYDIFFNNAYAGPAQTEILKKLIPQWTNTNKLIVNLNSKVSLLPPVHSPKVLAQPAHIQNFFADYYINKQSQNNLISQTLFKASPRIMNIFCGFVETYSAEFFVSKNKMTPDEVADMLIDLIKYKDKIYIQQITFDAFDIDYSAVDYDFDAIEKWGLRNNK